MHLIYCFLSTFWYLEKLQKCFGIFFCVCFGLQGALVLFYRARYHMVLAEFDASVSCLQRSMRMQNQLPQLHHMCLWELLLEFPTFPTYFNKTGTELL